MNFNLAQLLEVVVRRWYVMAIALILGVAVAMVIGKHARQFIASSAVVLTTQTGSSTSPSSPGAATAELTIQPSDLTILIQSENVLSRVARDINFGGTADVLGKQIKAHVGLQADVMPIQFTDKDPNKAIAGANAVADELTRYYRELAMSRFDQLISDLRKQSTAKRADLARFDADLQRTIARDPIVAGQDPTAMSLQFAALQTQRDQLEAAAKGDEKIADYGVALSTATLPLARHEINEDDPAFVALRKQFSADSAELHRLEAAYSSSYPGLPELRANVAREAQQVAAAQQRLNRTTPLSSKSYNLAVTDQFKAMGQQVADNARLAQIDAQIAALRASVSGRLGSSVTAASMRRDRAAADSALALLQARLAAAEADRSVAGSLGSIAVISQAEYAVPATWTKPKVILLAMLAAAFWLGLGAIALLERFDRRLRSRKQIESLYGIPVVTSVGASV